MTTTTTTKFKKTKGVKLEICIQPASDGRMIIALPNKKIAALSEKQWARFHRLLTNIYEEAR